MIEHWIPFVLTGAIVAGEATSLRTRRDAPEKDRGSYFVFRGSLAAGVVAAFAWWTAGTLPQSLSLGAWSPWAGAALALPGIALRVWAMHTLGAYFTRVVHVSRDQKVIETGPYRLLRHPSYTGAGLSLIGVGISMGNAVPALLIGVPFLMGVSYRIRVEERALLETLGDAYSQYMKRTKRLIPYVF